MKAFRLGAFSTRKFQGWLQTFNVLCGAAALSILGFGVYHLTARGGSRVVQGVASRPDGGGPPRIDGVALERRLELTSAGEALGQALPPSDEELTLAVLDAAAADCLPGSLALELALATREGRVGEAARTELARTLALPATPSRDELLARARELLAKPEPRDLTLDLAARAIVRGSAFRRRAATERLLRLEDGRGAPALLLVLGTPPAEAPTQALAEQALVALAGGASPPGDGTPEERWRAWWESAHTTWRAAPYDLARLAEPLGAVLSTGDELSRRDALRGLGLLRDERLRAPAAELLAHAPDPLARADGAWALGRVGGAAAAAPLARALSDPVPFVRAAAAAAIGAARLEAARPALRPLLDSPDETLRLAAALALLRFRDRSALAEVDVVAYDEQRTPVERLGALRRLDDAGDAACATSRWIAALSDPDPGVHEAARLALSRHVPRGTVLVGRKAWEEWWGQRWGDSGLRIPLGLGAG